jgi:hypothetical protein
MEDLSVIIKVPTIVRDQWSGYDTPTTMTFALSVYEAYSLMNHLKTEIPRIEAENVKLREKHVEKLKNELRSYGVKVD